MLANFERIVLGCIEAEFYKQILNTRLKALDEIYKIYKFFLHRSAFKISAEFRQISLFFQKVVYW